MEEKITAVKKQWRDNIIWIIIAGSLVMFGGDLLAMFVIPEVHESQSYLFTLMAYMEFLPTWVSVLIAIFCFEKNRYMKDTIMMNSKGNTLSFLLFGFLLGFLLNGLCALIAGLHGDIQLKFLSFDFLPVLGLFIAVFVQSSAEEVLCRGFIYQRLLHANEKPIWAVLLNSLFFAVIHLANDGISFLAFYDLLMTGIFFSLVVYYFDSLWMAMAIHTSWNFTQSILLGLPNSGESFPYSIFQLNANNTHASFAYNTAFGLEGTILSAVLMTISCIVLYVWKNKEKKLLTY
ncbi:CPBP family intramembrane glutamic endopeptidase [Streptococcus catagoni]|uniref:CPBP family intramembrane glutamic endopeptidase n=1 Tax=Streptococcus catagoni TaxID=2654874 RepID=UPI00140E2D61|nr:CPBP family intramembrane glutamic endopeptidase [Streptococcus catagoni]